MWEDEGAWNSYAQDTGGDTSYNSYAPSGGNYGYDVPDSNAYSWNSDLPSMGGMKTNESYTFEPSKAYGFGSCSDKWKVDPQEKWLNMWTTGSITKLIGFGSDEAPRAAKRPNDTHARRYPLIEWDWDRAACVAALVRVGLPNPGKSACFYCPSSKTREILELRKKYPDLLARALEMERRALAGEGQAPALHTIKGLGRNFSWAEFLRQTDAQGSLFTDADVPQDCTGESCFV